MSIEAMKLVIGAFDSLSTDHPARHTVLHINALRTAIQQAEAQQPITGEPVLTVEKEPDYWSGGHFHKGSKPHINPMKVWSLPIGTKLYTHPAPSGLGDSKRLDYLQDRGATIDLIAGVAAFYPMRFRVGGLHSSANIDVRAAIDAAMLAAK